MMEMLNILVFFITRTSIFLSFGVRVEVGLGVLDVVGAGMFRGVPD